ncbi:sulfurtransferase [Nocardioides anomalus]|uniref:Sulfurtransferase n=1 Tax=Nocardioides anomalus TaxID=2712223 RepID=A0A6G6WBY9_9ACTN|nr:sulfurtransferase [Nocardioides anomalus]QIG42861.1 sulfurtransferase [Nocardioides anomalus]
MSSPLIDAAKLLELLDRGEVTVLDVRYRLGGPPGRREYDAGHVPGAAYVDLNRDLAAPPGAGGRHPLPDPEAFGAAMRRAGVSADRPVVVYDDWAGHAAGRAWWLLCHHGHPDVRVLDGGWSAWREAGGAVQASTPTVAEGDFRPGPGAMPVVEADRLLDVPVVVDARAAERYRGEVEPVDPVAGHVPGAVNVPTSTNLDAHGRFRDPAQLRALYEAAGVPTDGSVEVAVYCGSGVTATHDLIALELLGVRAALYPGSWSGWITDPERPVETS